MTRKKTLWAWSLSALWALTDVALRVVLELDSGPPLHPPLGHRRRYCTPRPPPELHHQQSQRRRNPSPPFSRSSSSSSDLLLLVTQVKVDHRPANFWARGWRREGGAKLCTFDAFAAEPLKAAATLGWTSTGGPPPLPRLERPAPALYFQPHVKQGPRLLKGGLREGER